MLWLMRRLSLILAILSPSVPLAAEALLAPGLGEGCLALAGAWQLDQEAQAVALARPLPPSLCPAGSRMPEPPAAERGGARRIFLFDALHPERLLAFALRDETAPAWRPETGMWWSLDPAQREGVPGSGLFLEVQGEALSVWIASYDEAGRATWWMAAGPFEGSVFHGELLEFEGGPLAFREPRPPRSARSAAQIAMRFHGPARAEVWIARSAEGGLSLHAFEAARFVFGMPPGVSSLAGDWEWSADAAQASPLRLRLRRIPSAEGELLADPSRWVYLRCEAVSEGLPPRCALFAFGGSTAIAEFEAVGLNLLDGRDLEGREHRLRRIAPPPPADRENRPPAAGEE